jgi:CheY-like chemotaxis protein
VAEAPARTILVVEDSEIIRRFVSFALRAQGHRVLTASDGLAALETLAVERVDLVVTDLCMPGLDGFSLLRALREDPLTADTPVVVLSALSGGEPIERSLALGASAYLVKPLETASLQREVARHLF